jgi:hypothetical protein
MITKLPSVISMVKRAGIFIFLTLSSITSHNYGLMASLALVGPHLFLSSPIYSVDIDGIKETQKSYKVLLR